MRPSLHPPQEKKRLFCFLSPSSPFLQLGSAASHGEAAGQSGPKRRTRLMAFIKAALWMRRTAAHRAHGCKTQIRDTSRVGAHPLGVVCSAASCPAPCRQVPFIHLICGSFSSNSEVARRDCGGGITSFPFLTWAKFSAEVFPLTAFQGRILLLFQKGFQPKHRFNKNGLR